jgi:hypothetical protein
MNLIQHEKSDIIFIQEPYLYKHRMTGITSSYSKYSSLEDNNRAAIVITNKRIDAVLITELSNPDTVLLEQEYNTKFFTASMYFDITTEIERELDKIDQILEFTKGNGLIIAVNSNCRSAAWHDTQTNKRGKTLEEYIISKSLFIMNERSEGTTFHNRRGKSNIDLTIVNNLLLKALWNWEIWDEESCSDHSIIKFCIGQSNKPERQDNHHGTRYTINEQNYDRFDKNLKKLVATKF